MSARLGFFGGAFKSYHIYILFFLWLCCNLVSTFFTEHENKSLLDTVDSGLSWPIFSACLVLILFTFLVRTRKRAGFRFPDFKGAWILVYPVLVIIIVFGSTVSSGKFAAGVYGFIFVNTLMAGFSEEVMFRGYLLTAIAEKTKFITAAVLVTGLFGAVHMLNYFTTGDLLSSVGQSLLAAFSGLLFLAIRVKTNSILPGIIIHGLFDFVIMTRLYSVTSTSDSFDTIVSLLIAVSPIIFGVTGIIQLTRKGIISRFSESEKQTTLPD